MKFKKIIALSVCAMMALSTVANADYTIDEGWYVTSDISKTDLENRNLSVDIDVVEVDSATAKEAGLSLGRGASALTDDNSDFYKIDVTLSNIGDLMDAWLDTSDFSKEVQVMLAYAKVAIPNVTFKKIYIDSAATFNGTAWETSTAGNEDNLLSVYWNGTTKMYPSDTEEGTYVENFAFDTVTVYIAVDAGYTVTATPSASVTYSYRNGSLTENMSAETNKATLVNGDVVIKPATQDDDGDDDAYDFSAGTKHEYADGIVWAGASMTNFDTTENEYWAIFNAKGEDTDARKTQIKGLEAYESAGSVTFDAVMWFAGEAKENVTFRIDEVPMQ